MFNYRWSKKDYPKTNGLTVFSTFACGGGSTMGYKLAGFNVIGANDIDPQMADVYDINHHPTHLFECSIQELLDRELPRELYNLDVLDGSPPCSTFSMAGSREKVWKKKKKFREGQEEQVLSDLFFDWIKLVDKLQPKVAIAENVLGMLFGNAKSYTKIIIEELDKIGYSTQLFLLNSATMGVPQRRERVFFICTRGDIDKKIKLDFKIPQIPYKEIAKDVKSEVGKPLSEAYRKWWELTPAGASFSKYHPKGSFFNTYKISPFKVLNTITATSGAKITHHSKPNEVSNEILGLSGSFPTDYDYLDIDPKYLIGMSVPPVMMACIAKEVKEQLLN